MKHEIAQAKLPEVRRTMGLENSTRSSFERLRENGAAQTKLAPETRVSFERVDLMALTDAERKYIEKDSGWSIETVDRIGSVQEYEVYKQAGLHEAKINERSCLIRSDIDWDQKDAMGRTNSERIEQGLAPYDRSGITTIELHHIGQHPDSPLAELTMEEHRGKENYSVLHYKGGESEIDRAVFDGERREHWKSRAEEGGNL